MRKEISELYFPDDLKYTDDHEWARVEGPSLRVGITDYAQDQLGEIVFVEMPEVGNRYKKNGEFGALESVKAVSEIYTPVGGEIVAINAALQDAPGLVNEDPYGKGWIIEIRIEDPAELDTLKNKDAYLEMLKGN